METVDKNIKALIFDLDGTLSYTLDSIAKSGNVALEEIGFSPLPTDNYRYYCGDGAEELVKRILIDSGDTELKRYQELREKYRETFKKYSEYKVRPYEGMTDTISKLKEMGYRLAVLSNKPHEQCIEVVNKLYGENTFELIQGNTPSTRRKPSPDGAVLIADKLGLDADDFLYVGDTATDMQTGNGAGMTTVGVLWGYRDEKELREAGAAYLIKSPEEILTLITRD